MDYSKEEIEEAVTGENKKSSSLKRRIQKWDLILNEIHEDLRFLHEEFQTIYKALNKLEVKDENLDR